MPLVGFVTPADDTTLSYAAFKDELCNRFGWDPSILQPYPASAWGGIQGAAHQAIADLDPHGVLIGAGEMAAYYLQEETKATTPPNQIPIIMAYGGGKPDNAGNKNKNMIGLLGDCENLAIKQHLKALKQNFAGDEITVLYDQDADNQPPQIVNRVTKKILGKLKDPGFGGDAQINAQPIDTANITQDGIAELLTTPGLMMIPNANFFEQAGAITGAVDDSHTVQMAIYPEFDYWHKHKNRGKAKVFGYNVPLTYRLAALWVDHLLTGYWDLNYITGLNKRFAQAIPDDYGNWITLRSRRRRH